MSAQKHQYTGKWDYNKRIKGSFIKEQDDFICCFSVRVSDVYTKAAGSLFGLAKVWTQWLDAHQPQAIQEGALIECEATLIGSLKLLLDSHSQTSPQHDSIINDNGKTKQKNLKNCM